MNVCCKTKLPSITDMLCIACPLSNPDFFEEKEGAIQLGILPFYHMFAGFVNMCLGLAWGQTSVTLTRYQPELFLEVIQKYKVYGWHLLGLV